MDFTYDNLYMSMVCGQEVGRTRLHVEIVSNNITHFSLWNMLPNPAGPPIIMADPQIYFCLFWDTDHTTKSLERKQHKETKLGM